jgi:macrolide-specific efflux system membrane fusion protein
MSQTSKRIAITLGILLVIIAGVAFYRYRSAPKIRYRAAQAERGDIAVTILDTGTVQPENRLEIKPPIAGRAEQVLVKEGQYVKKGQVLVWMSSTERAALLDAARSKGPEEVKKWEDLYRPTPVLAPINGTIILRSVEPGQTFTNSDSILVMSDRLTVKAQVDETDIAQIKLKQSAEIALDAYPDQPIPANVDHIAFDATTVNNVTIYLVDVLPEETPSFMRSGMTANVRFLVASKSNVLLISSEAIQTKNGKATVLTRTSRSENPVQRTISPGISDGKQTEILAGLTEGETVLIPRVVSGGNSVGSNPFSMRRKKSR